MIIPLFRAAFLQSIVVVTSPEKRMNDTYEQFVGESFGSKGAIRLHVPLAAMCARYVGRPVTFA